MKHLRILLLLAGLFLIASPARQASALSLSNPSVAAVVAAEGTATATTEVRWRRYHYRRYRVVRYRFVRRHYVYRRHFHRRHYRFY